MIFSDCYACLTSSGYTKYEVVNELLKPCYLSSLVPPTGAPESLLIVSYMLPSVCQESSMRVRWDLNPHPCAQYPHCKTVLRQLLFDELAHCRP
ncbi:hypothetical protein TNCV_4282231 [Trichonephila clavipes]|nr:hypothetical protein TNCV_4282231 [Trichonephila clavipes]